MQLTRHSKQSLARHLASALLAGQAVSLLGLHSVIGGDVSVCMVNRATLTCSAQRVLQAESDRLAKQLEEERTCSSKGIDDLKQHHAQQLSALQLQLTKQQQMLVNSSATLVNQLHH